MTEKIEALLKHFGVSVAGLEKILNLSNGYISSVTNKDGKRKTVDNPGKMLVALNEKGISTDWFLTGEGEMLRNRKVGTVEKGKHPIVTGVEALVEHRVAELESGILSRLAELEARLEAGLGRLPASEPAPKPSIVRYPAEAKYPAEAEYPAESRPTEEVREPEPEYSVVRYGKTAAGPPLQTMDESYEAVKVPGELMPPGNPEDFFAFHVEGNSMIHANIPDGSLVLVKRSDVPAHNRIQVVYADNGLTIKRMVEGEDHGLTLHYEDGSGDTIPLKDKDYNVLGNFVLVLPPAIAPYDLDEWRASDDEFSEEA